MIIDDNIDLLFFFFLQGDPGKFGETGPYGEPGIPVCIGWAFLGGGCGSHSIAVMSLNLTTLNPGSKTLLTGRLPSPPSG